MTDPQETTLFPSGESGNYKGRQKGALNKATEYRLAVQEAMMDEMHQKAVELVRRIMEDALDGDATARKIIMDRLLPAKKAVSGEVDNRKGNIIINVTTKKDETTLVTGEVIDHESE